MAKRKSKDIRKDVLKALSDGKERSYGYLERKVDTNWETIRNHCDDLKLFEAIVISGDNKVKITKKGMDILKRCY